MNITAIVDDDGTDNANEVRELVIFSFGRFNTSLVYDPINAMASTSSSGASALTVSVMIVLAIILALVNIL